MEYDSETKTLKYNGLPINEINVNGEAFFAGDNKMALENLPVELISKIKVYDKKSKLEKLTGVSTGKKTMYSTCRPKQNSMGPFFYRDKPDMAITTKRTSTCKVTTSRITETTSPSLPTPVISI